MRRPLTVRRLLTLIALVLAWCALWGEVTLANLLAGVAIAVVLTALGIGSEGRGGVRLVPLARFVGLVMIDLVVSTVTVAKEILTPIDSTEEAIVAVGVPIETRRHLLLMIVAITLTPGTAVVDADADTGTLYLHLLHVDRRDAVTAHVRTLAELACLALPEQAAKLEAQP